MRLFTTVLLGLLTAPGLATTQQDESMAGHHHMMMGAARPTDAPIAITINPEARLSVALGGALPAPVSCGEPAELTVAITNQGFVTSQLEAAFVGDAPAGATLDFHPVPLTGAPNELRALRITLTHPGATDLTIAFHARHEAPDLGERDRVHFLLRCL